MLLSGLGRELRKREKEREWSGDGMPDRPDTRLCLGSQLQRLRDTRYQARPEGGRLKVVRDAFTETHALVAQRERNPYHGGSIGFLLPA